MIGCRHPFAQPGHLDETIVDGTQDNASPGEAVDGIPACVKRGGWY